MKTLTFNTNEIDLLIIVLNLAIKSVESSLEQENLDPEDEAFFRAHKKELQSLLGIISVG